jgi:hypothetical protein
MLIQRLDESSRNLNFDTLDSGELSIGLMVVYLLPQNVTGTCIVDLS